MTEIKYSSFAFAPYGIKVDKIYSFGQDSNGYFYMDAKEKHYLELAEIKMLFSPINGTWNSLLKTSKTEKKEN